MLLHDAWEAGTHVMWPLASRKPTFPIAFPSTPKGVGVRVVGFAFTCSGPRTVEVGVKVGALMRGFGLNSLLH
jgi:hypothetical protein